LEFRLTPIPRIFAAQEFGLDSAQLDGLC